MPKQLVTLIDHENKAVAISVFEATLVPGLLQTGEYARAVISRIANVPPGEVDDRVAARLARQSLFSRDRPARFAFYLHESPLRLPVGGSAVMAEQLRHLHRMSERSYLTVRVVPVALGAHAAMAGAFWLMEFAEFKPVAYLESETSSVFLEKPEEIRAYRNILGALADTALGGTITGADCRSGNRAAYINDRPGRLFKLITALGFAAAAVVTRKVAPAVAPPNPLWQPSTLTAEVRNAAKELGVGSRSWRRCMKELRGITGDDRWTLVVSNLEEINNLRAKLTMTRCCHRCETYCWLVPTNSTITHYQAAVETARAEIRRLASDFLLSSAPR